jgi:hypothetical protein
VNLAARGARKTGERAERIHDLAELIQVRRQSRRVLIKSLAAAAVITALTLVIPPLP